LFVDLNPLGLLLAPLALRAATISVPEAGSLCLGVTLLVLLLLIDDVAAVAWVLAQLTLPHVGRKVALAFNALSWIDLL